jgi:hypothetical protein
VEPECDSLSARRVPYPPSLCTVSCAGFPQTRAYVTERSVWDACQGVYRSSWTAGRHRDRGSTPRSEPAPPRAALAASCAMAAAPGWARLTVTGRPGRRTGRRCPPQAAHRTLAGLGQATENDQFCWGSRMDEPSLLRSLAARAHARAGGPCHLAAASSRGRRARPAKDGYVSLTRSTAS